jgi:hypothetical protein
MKPMRNSSAADAGALNDAQISMLAEISNKDFQDIAFMVAPLGLKTRHDTIGDSAGEAELRSNKPMQRGNGPSVGLPTLAQWLLIPNGCR